MILVWNAYSLEFDLIDCNEDEKEKSSIYYLSYIDFENTDNFLHFYKFTEDINENDFKRCLCFVNQTGKLKIAQDVVNKTLYFFNCEYSDMSDLGKLKNMRVFTNNQKIIDCCNFINTIDSNCFEHAALLKRFNYENVH